MEHVERVPPPQGVLPTGEVAAEVMAESAARSWVSPGVSARKRVLTGLGVAAASALFILIALTEGASMLVSTVIGIVFITGFIGYLRVVAPTPFTITVDAERLTRADAGAAPVVITWGGIAKVKEETFPNGRTVSITIYKRVGERGLHRAWVVYGDDLADFDALVAAVRAALPAGVLWIRETVHE